MTMKNLISIFIIALFLFGGKVKAQTVYITDSGKKYHMKNCDVAKTGKKGIELADAKKQGYEACKVCKADKETQPADKPKEKKGASKTKQ
jgi:hypothetical protein